MIHKYQAIIAIEYSVVDIHNNTFDCVFKIERPNLSNVQSTIAILRSLRTHENASGSMFINGDKIVSINIRQVLTADAIRFKDHKGNDHFMLLSNVPDINILD